MEYQGLAKKRVIVAGSEGLLGKTIAEAFTKEGIETIGLDVKLGHDFTQPTFVEKIFSQLKDYDVLINTFAINPQPDEASLSLLDLPLDSLERYLQVNLLALFQVCREFCKVCRQPASIINFSSTYGIGAPKHFIYEEPFEKHIGYTITKAGVIGLTKHFGTLLAPDIRVNAVVPGGVENNQNKVFQDKYSQMTPMGRMMQKEEIIGIVAYLASDASSYVTGSVLPVDGGWTAW